MLKMPFSKAPVSMMIHRVGRTLLIDNFDVYRHILLQQEADWNWMRRFIYDHILKSVPNAEVKLEFVTKSKALFDDILCSFIASPGSRKSIQTRVYE